MSDKDWTLMCFELAWHIAKAKWLHAALYIARLFRYFLDTDRPPDRIPLDWRTHKTNRILTFHWTIIFIDNEWCALVSLSNVPAIPLTNFNFGNPYLICNSSLQVHLLCPNDYSYELPLIILLRENNDLENDMSSCVCVPRPVVLPTIFNIIYSLPRDHLDRTTVYENISLNYFRL